MNINTVLERITACSARGADMGRQNVCDNESASVYVQKVSFQDGCYDLGGAYWGAPENLWCAMDEEGEVQLFTRAATRTHAIKQFLGDHPDLTVLDNREIDIDQFTYHYAMAALWSTCDMTEDDWSDREEHLDANYTVEDIHPDTMARFRKECAEFIEANKEDLLALEDDRYSVEELGGHDLWLTGVGAGVSFADRWPDEAGERLCNNAPEFEAIGFVVDGKVMFD